MLSVVPFGEWLPDLPDLGNKGALTATNVIPAQTSYRSFPALANTAASLSNTCQGFFAARDASANVYKYAGDDDKLYRVSLSATDATRLVGGAYATAADDYWEFAQFGNLVIATNFTDDPQKITLGAANFSVLGGAPPKAKHVSVVKDFVVFGNVSSYPNRVQWSAINNAEAYTISAAVQCDYQDLNGDYGWVQKVVGGQYGTVFQERGIWRMTYVGSPEIFTFDLVDNQRGTPAPQSVVPYGNVIFYLADDGFYYFDGAKSVPIGAGKVDRTFLSDVDDTYLYRVNGAVDPQNRIVCWAYPGVGHSSGRPNRIIIYNWAFNKWSIVETQTEILCRPITDGYTMDGLDVFSSNLDAISTPLDSRFWTGGKIFFGAFDSSHRLSTFTGAALAATVDTGEIQHNTAGRAFVRNVRPLVDGGATVQIAVGSRKTQAATAAFDTAVTVDDDGGCPVRADNRFFRYRVTTSGDFNDMMGLAVEWEPGSER